MPRMGGVIFRRDDMDSNTSTIVIDHVANGFIVRLPQRGDSYWQNDETNVFETPEALAAHVLKWAKSLPVA